MFSYNLPLFSPSPTACLDVHYLLFIAAADSPYGDIVLFHIE